MGNKLFIGNIAHSTSESSLESMFAGSGTVVSARIIKDRDSGRSKGFGFVEMGDDAQAAAAIQTLNGQDLEGRPLRVAEAKPMESRSSGDRNSGGGYGGGGNRRYGSRF